MWASWTFYMERFCGILKLGLRSRVQPWSNLNKRILHMAYLQALASQYDLEPELSVVGFPGHGEDGERRNEMIYEQCMYSQLISHTFSNVFGTAHNKDPDHVMRAPHIRKHKPDPELRTRIATYLGILIGRKRTEIAKHLPPTMSLWGKMRIRHGGDAFRSTFITKRNHGTPGRNNSFGRVSIFHCNSTNVLTCSNSMRLSMRYGMVIR